MPKKKKEENDIIENNVAEENGPAEDADENAVQEPDAREAASDDEDAQSKKNHSRPRPNVTGILEIADGGFGFLRFDNFLTSDKDVYV